MKFYLLGFNRFFVVKHLFSRKNHLYIYLIHVIQNVKTTNKKRIYKLYSKELYHIYTKF